MKLALKVRTQKVYGNSTTTKSVVVKGFAEDLISKNPSDAKSIPKTQVNNEVHKPHQESTLKWCYKCQGLGHIASECPNQKVVSLIEDYEAKEEDVEQVMKSNHVQEDGEKSSLQSKSELEIEFSYDVIDLVVVQEIESEKEIP